MRRIRLEIAIEGDRIVSAACCECVAPLKGFWRRFTMIDHTNSEPITRQVIIAGLREVLNHSAKDSRHG